MLQHLLLRMLGSLGSPKEGLSSQPQKGRFLPTRRAEIAQRRPWKSWRGLGDKRRECQSQTALRDRASGEFRMLCRRLKLDWWSIHYSFGVAVEASPARIGANRGAE